MDTSRPNKRVNDWIKRERKALRKERQEEYERLLKAIERYCHRVIPSLKQKEKSQMVQLESWARKNRIGMMSRVIPVDEMFARDNFSLITPEMAWVVLMEVHPKTVAQGIIRHLERGSSVDEICQHTAGKRWNVNLLQDMVRKSALYLLESNTLIRG